MSLNLDPTPAPLENSEQLDALTEGVATVVSVLKGLTAENRTKLLNSVAAIFGLATIGESSARPASGRGTPLPQSSYGNFSEDRTISAKDFLMQKQPHTDVERVACLAYYLTHYRDVPHFKTLDISKLNTEAAQMKFSNAAKSVDNATAQGYLAPATKGNKQISAPGEMFVLALPDRDAARAAMAHARPRRKSKRGPLTAADKASSEAIIPEDER